MPTGGFVGGIDSRSSGNAGANSIYLMQVTAPRSGSATAVVIDILNAYSGINFKALVYDGNHSVLLATGSTVTSLSAGYNRLPLTAPLSLTAGTSYYVGYVCDSSVNVSIGGSANAWFAAGGQNVTTPANPLATGASQSNPLFIALELDGTASPGFGFGPDYPAAGVTLSISNTRATISGATANLGARSIVTQAPGTGKFYAEVTIDGPINNNVNVGLAAVAWNPTQGVSRSDYAYFYMLQPNGNRYDGTAIGLTYASGDTLSIAYDATNNLLWWSKNNGSWFGASSAAGSPSAGTGGLPIQSAAWPMAISATTGASSTAAVFTLRETTGALLYTPPAGFSAWSSASFTPPPVTATAQLTQTAIEEWIVATAPAQVTQVAIEEWVVGNPQLLVTQAGIEQFTVPVPPFLVTQTAIEHWGSALTTYPTPLLLTTTLSASRAGIGSVVLVADNATRDVMLADIGVMSQVGQFAPTGAGTLTGVAATGAAGTIIATALILTTVQIAGVFAVTAFGLLTPAVVARLPGVSATGVAAPILVFAGPVTFLPDVYATGAAGPLFAIAGGIVEKFRFFMAGPF